jgi:hypothetical protein
MNPKCNRLSEVKNEYVPVLRTSGTTFDTKVRNALWGQTPKYVTHFGVGPQCALNPKVRCYRAQIRFNG